MEVLISGYNIEYSISNNNCHIVDSYMIKGKRAKLNFISYVLFEYEGFAKARSSMSYYREWKAHNILYKWKVKPESTKDTDLNTNESLIRRLGYFFISLLFKE